jgi:uncharacterized protein YrrD
MNARDLKGMAVVVLADADRVGHVDDILFDAQYRQVFGFRVKHGVLGHSEMVLRRDVTAIGRDAITIASRAALNMEERFPELVEASTLGRVEGTHVVTEGGTRLGGIRSVELDDQAQCVAYYALDRTLRERLHHEEPRLDADYVRGIGERGIMIVADEAGMSPDEENAQAREPQASQANDGQAQGQPRAPMATGMPIGQAQPQRADQPQGQPPMRQAQPQPGQYGGQPLMGQGGGQLQTPGVHGEDRVQHGPMQPGFATDDQTQRQDVSAPAMSQPAMSQPAMSQPAMGQPSGHRQSLPQPPMTERPPMQPPMQGQPSLQRQDSIRQGQPPMQPPAPQQPTNTGINQARGPEGPGIDQPQQRMAPPMNQGQYVNNQGMPNQPFPSQANPNQGQLNQAMPNQEQRRPIQQPPQRPPMPGQEWPDQLHQGQSDQPHQGWPDQNRQSLPPEDEQSLPPTYP